MVPLYIVYADNTIESGDAINTVLFHAEDGNVIGEIKNSVIITRKVIDDGEELCGSLGDGDIDMIMARIANNNHKVFYLPVYAGEDSYFTPARD